MRAQVDFAYLTTTGRRSGRPRTVELWFAEHGRTLYFLAGAGMRAHWVANLVADPAVRVRIGGPRQWRPEVSGTVDGVGRLVCDPDEEALARRLVDGKYYGGAELTPWGATALVVAVDR